MCYQTASSASPAGRAALRHGVVILLVPALSLFIAILALIYSRRTPRKRFSSLLSSELVHPDRN
jgi:hypothetical protein